VVVDAEDADISETSTVATGVRPDHRGLVEAISIVVPRRQHLANGRRSCIMPTTRCHINNYYDRPSEQDYS